MNIPKFYCLYNSQTDSANLSERISKLKNACVVNDIDFILLDEATIDFSTLPKPTENDGLYNCARGSMLLERAIINKKVKTFYRSFPYVGLTEKSNYWSILHEKFEIATPRTVWKGTNDRSLLKQYINYLEGFPIILKTYGGTSGIGVIKIESYATLFSIADYLVNNNSDFALKQFIPAKSCERVRVLGNEVIEGISRPIRDNDFRSDGLADAIKYTTFSNEVNELAINAVHSVNLSLGGVDIIIDERDNKPYVLEVNFPLNIVTIGQTSKVDIADKMIAWLFRKKE